MRCSGVVGWSARARKPPPRLPPLSLVGMGAGKPEKASCPTVRTLRPALALLLPAAEGGGRHCAGPGHRHAFLGFWRPLHQGAQHPQGKARLKLVHCWWVWAANDPVPGCRYGSMANLAARSSARACICMAACPACRLSASRAASWSSACATGCCVRAAPVCTCGTGARRWSWCGMPSGLA